MYLAYGDKHGLITAVLRHAHQQWADQIAPPPDDGTAEAVKRLTTTHALDAETLFVRALVEQGDDAAEPRLAANEHVDALTDLLTAAAQADSTTDPATVGRQLTLLVHGAVAQVRAGRPVRTAARDAQEAAAALLSAPPSTE